MQVNYFGALRLTLGLLPGMAQRRSGHVINVSSIGVLTNAPRFSAYVASKAALEAFSRCAASEFLDRGVHFTTINMPLVRTDMIAPTKLYEHAPTLTPEEAAELVVEAIVKRPSRIATPLGRIRPDRPRVQPRVAQIVMNTAFRMFPDSAAATGAKQEAAERGSDRLHADHAGAVSLIRSPNVSLGDRIPLARKSAHRLQDFRAIPFKRIAKRSCGNRMITRLRRVALAQAQALRRSSARAQPNPRSPKPPQRAPLP